MLTRLRERPTWRVIGLGFKANGAGAIGAFCALQVCVSVVPVVRAWFVGGLIRAHLAHGAVAGWYIALVSTWLVADALSFAIDVFQVSVASRTRAHLNSRAASAGLGAQLETFDDPSFHDNLHVVAGRTPISADVISGLFAALQRTGLIISTIGILASIQQLAWWPGPLLVGSWLFASRFASSGFEYLAQAAREAATSLKPYVLLRNLLLGRRGSEESRTLQAAGQLEQHATSTFDRGIRQAWSGSARAISKMIVGNAPAIAATCIVFVALLSALKDGNLDAGAATTIVINVIALSALADPSTSDSIQRGATVAKALTLLHVQQAPEPATSPTIVRSGSVIEISIDLAQAGDRTLLRDVSLSLPSRGTVALVGTNGSGKTTFLRVVAGLRHNAQQNTEPPILLSQHRTRPSWTVREYLSSGRLPSDVPLPDFPKILTSVGLESLTAHLDSRLVRDFEGGLELSGGQWQRLAIARVLAAATTARDATLLLDEPTTHIDPDSAHDLWRLIRNAAIDSLVIVATHDSSVVEECDVVVWFEGGRVRAAGPHSHLLNGDAAYATFWATQDPNVETTHA